VESAKTGAFVFLFLVHIAAWYSWRRRVFQNPEKLKQDRHSPIGIVRCVQASCVQSFWVHHRCSVCWPKLLNWRKRRRIHVRRKVDLFIILIWWFSIDSCPLYP